MNPVLLLYQAAFNGVFNLTILVKKGTGGAAPINMDQLSIFLPLMAIGFKNVCN